MTKSNFTYDLPPKSRSSALKEEHIETIFINKLSSLKYTLRPDIHDRASLEANFRQKLEDLNRVRLTDGEFVRLLDETVTPDVFAASRLLRERNSFVRDISGLSAYEQ